MSDIAETAVFCPNGHPISPTDKFCETCGTVINSRVIDNAVMDNAAICKNGHPMESDYLFCEECGAKPTTAPDDVIESDYPPATHFTDESRQSIFTRFKPKLATFLSPPEPAAPESVSETTTVISKPRVVVPAGTTTPIQPITIIQNATPSDGLSRAPLTPGSYLSYQILFAIPIIGWIAVLICSLRSKNINARNFARSYLLFLLIMAGVLILAWSAIGTLLGSIFNSL